MINVIISLKQNNSNFLFGFKTLDSAKAARENYIARAKQEFDPGTQHVTIKDDFGMQADIPVHDIAAFVIEDQAEAMRVSIERDIVKKREQTAFMERRNKDIELMRLYPSNQPQGVIQ